MSDKTDLENNNLRLQNITDVVTNLPDYVEIKNQNKIITENGMYNADVGYTGLGTINVNVPSSSGSVKLFDTVANMQAEQNPNASALAVVYKDSISNVTQNSEFDKCTFPNEVILTESIGNSIYGGFIDVDGSFGFYIDTEISQYQARFRWYTSTGSVEVNYYSYDGLTYTRTDGGDELMDFGVIVKWNTDYSQWNDVVGMFMLINDVRFDGLYKAQTFLDENYISWKPLNSFFINANTNGYYPEIYNVNVSNEYLPNIFNTQNIVNCCTNYLQNELGESYAELSLLLCNDNNIYIPRWWDFDNDSAIMYNDVYLFYEHDTATNYIGITYGGSEYDGYNRGLKLYQLNLNNSGYGFNRNVTSNFINSVYVVSDVNIIGLPISYAINVYDDNRFRCQPIPILYDNINSTSMAYIYPNESDLYGIYSPVNRYVIANTQFTASPEYVYGKSFYGPNGSEIGTLQQIENLSLEQIKHRDAIFSNWSIITMNVGVNNMHGLFESDQNLVSIINMDTSNVIDMSKMFYDCQNLASVPNFDTSNVTNMGGMFTYCTNLTNIPDFDTSNVNDMSSMFIGVNSLFYNGFPYFNTSNVTNMRSMFSRTGISTVPNQYDTSNVTDMAYMFSYTYITAVNGQEFNTSNVTDMSNMFLGCRNVNMYDCDTSNVINMRGMFNGCCYMKDASNLDTSNVTDMGHMYSQCRQLVNVPNYNTINVISMSYMFNWCGVLTSVPNFDTSNVTSMSGMFRTCYNLTTVPAFNTSKVTDMSWMFSGCDNLTTVPNFNTSEVTNMVYMFSGCDNLTTVSQFNTALADNMYNMFYECNKLSNSSIHNIVNMCLNSNITNSTMKNLNNTNRYSPLYYTKFNSSYYSNRLSELTSAGWNY